MLHQKFISSEPLFMVSRLLNSSFSSIRKPSKQSIEFFQQSDCTQHKTKSYLRGAKTAFRNEKGEDWRTCHSKLLNWRCSSIFIRPLSSNSPKPIAQNYVIDEHFRQREIITLHNAVVLNIVISLEWFDDEVWDHENFLRKVKFKINCNAPHTRMNWEREREPPRTL